MSNHQDERFGADEPGSWLPLRVAARELGLPERLANRLVADGKLRSREGESGRIEIWVADAARARDEPTPPFQVIDDGRSTALAEQLSGTVQTQLTALMAPLAESYDRNTRLARENGALAERAASLERELQALREATASDRQALEQARKRLEAVEGANAGLTRMLDARTEEQAQSRRQGPRLWLWLAVVLSLCAVAAVLWFADRLPTPLV
jgi:hypothetical protein